ncbi:serine hydrolase domain-containing protein [Caulobacter sp.]|uniref:serine hydrolase domain-containing protein n=1 Tax=Caulobacter sp. TaxID=78 RepID=UPI003BAF976D
MRLLTSLAGLLAALALPAAAQAPDALKPTAPFAPSRTATVTATPSPPGAAQLTAADVNAWLDGLVPYGLDRGDIAGAVVVVVKDGQVLTQRGYGVADVKTRRPVDPAQTLFRPGSISKLFTWTAVMQQVEAGKIDLDRDINDYLDFKIPPAFGKPITMRHLMTHTAGFEETAKHLLIDDPAKDEPLDVVLKRWTPERIYAPGAMAAYSNYGASLAGYIVQRVSGEPFAVYVDRHIFAPLGMTRSSFVQPLPPALAGGMSKGYVVSSRDPKAFELIGMTPAGALSSTGSDMARFMIAHLEGGPLLKPQTAQLMYAAANTPIPGLPAMALGFYHEDRNGRRIIGHGGDTDLFHSDLHLFLDDHVGLYLSFNSGGKDGAAHVLRERLFAEFTNRYFPYPDPQVPTLATAKVHGAAMVGHYGMSRTSTSNFLKLIGLISQTRVALSDDGTLTVAALLGTNGVPKRWREVAPWQWREVGGDDRLAAVVKDGKVTMFSIAGYAPIFEFTPAPASFDAGWILPAAMAALGVILLTALAWPVLTFTRWRYGHQPAVVGRPALARWAPRVTPWALLVICGGWLAMVTAIDNDVTMLDGRLDIWMRLLQALSLAAIVGSFLMVWNAWILARSPQRRWLRAAWAALSAVSALFLIWLLIVGKTLTLSLNY